MNHYRCDNGVEFDLRMGGGTAVLDMGAKGSETLLRDAGGVTPQQSVYTNARVRGEFGQGASGSEVVLHYATAPLVVRCMLATAP